MEREHFSSRLGFILISAGCAIGLGNVWKFPYVTGQYGGGLFVLIYLFFLVILGLPIMISEFAVGRASQKSAALSFDVLEPKKSKWHLYKYAAIAGNYLLMMFYTTIGGWILNYCYKMATGEFENASPQAIENTFGSMLENPSLMIICMVIIVAVCFAICGFGIQKGIEKITKVMMLLLLALMIVLAVRSIMLPGASKGLEFYLIPDLSKLSEIPLSEVIFAAMGQAFFTLSLGIGAIAIFGSYIGKERALTGEAICVTVLDTAVAILSGLIIFPACYAFNINPGQGPSLIFITLPNVFNGMSNSRVWGTIFFICMLFAAMSTIIAIFENLISFAIDLTDCSRAKAIVVNFILIVLLSLPCILGFNLWSGFDPFGGGSNILDLEDFIISNNLLPLGSLVYLLFCVSRYGWGFKNFIAEVDSGKGLRFPKWSRQYLRFILPLIILVIFVQGYISKFFM